MMPDNKTITIYDPTVWKDHVVEKPRTYEMLENEDGTATLIPSEGEVMQQGTPMNADNLNKLESGLKKATEEMQAYAENGTAANALCLDGKPPEYYLILENFFDNSNWTDPIYQAGLGGLHGTITYALDRWIYNSTADKLSLNNGAGLSFGVGTAICQRPVRCNVKDGNDYTIAIWTSDGSVHCTRLTADWTTAGGSGYSATHGNENCVYIHNSGDGLPIKYVGLFKGEYTADQLHYVAKRHAVELDDCKRYYCQSWDGNTPSAYGCLLLQAFAMSRLTNVELPVEMRIVPTIIIYSARNEPGKVRDYLSGEKIASGMSAVYANKKSFIPGSNVSELEANTVYALHYAACADP